MGERVYTGALGFDEDEEFLIYAYAYGKILNKKKNKKVSKKLETCGEWREYVEDKYLNVGVIKLRELRCYLDSNYRILKSKVPGINATIMPVVLLIVNMYINIIINGILSDYIADRLVKHTIFWQGISIVISFFLSLAVVCIAFKIYVAELNSIHATAVFYEDYIRIIDNLIEYCEN